MSANEALRTQLDAVRTELYALQAENRRLKEANPDRAELLTTEQELQQTREENVKLVQQIDALTTQHAKEADAGVEATTRADALETDLAEARRAWKDAEERAGEAATKLEEATARAERAEEYARKLEDKAERAQTEAELERYRALKEETRKWEEREARLVRRLEELQTTTATEYRDGGNTGEDAEESDTELVRDRQTYEAVATETHPRAKAAEEHRRAGLIPLGMGKRATECYDRGNAPTEGDRAKLEWWRATKLQACGREDGEEAEGEKWKERERGGAAARQKDQAAVSCRGLGSGMADYVDHYKAETDRSDNDLILSPTSMSHASGDFPANGNTNVDRPTKRINNKIFIPKKTTVRSPVEQGTTMETHRSVLHSPTPNVDATPFVPLGRYSAGDHLGPNLPVQPTGETLTSPQGDSLSMILMAQQLPSLPTFSGERTEGDSEGFDDWLERLELVANMCGWNDQTKLVNVVTRLRGAASSFYRSCAPQDRASYIRLVTALQQRFTPVKIQSVQSSRFHERRQGSKEKVDVYAQDLRRLFQQAYTTAQLDSEGAATMGGSVLAYQFVAGLVKELKAKLVGAEGTFEQLLERARFEEARIRELGNLRPAEPEHSYRRGPVQLTGNKDPPQTSTSRGKRACYNCGGVGHFARDCSLRGRGAPFEARGRGKNRDRQNTNRTRTEVVSMVQATIEGKKKQEKDSEETANEENTPLRRSTACRTDTVDDAIMQVMATMHGVQPSTDTTSTVKLGLTPLSQVRLDGQPAEALLDTGSPISIVSMELFLKIAVANRKVGQSPEEWAGEVKRRLEPTTVSLQSYGGGKLDIIKQVQCSILHADRAVQVIVQVQRGAPVGLLLGTDILPQLGFALVKNNSSDTAVNLLDTPAKTDQPETIHLSSEVNKPEVANLMDSSAERKNTEVADLQNPSANPKNTEATNLSDPPAKPKAAVKLIRAVRLPPRYSKMVRIEPEVEEVLPPTSTCLFRPEPKILEEYGLTMPETVVEIQKEMTLQITNHQTEPIQLNAGQVLGELEPAAVTEYGRNDLPEWEPTVAAIRPDQKKRRKRLYEALQLAQIDLPPGEKEQLCALVDKFTLVFALDNSELGRATEVTHSITTTCQQPCRQPPRRVPFSLRGKVQQLIQEMLAQGIIQQSSSPWASPIVLVTKQDGSTRFCVDYRKLNAATKLDVYPLPRIDDSLDLLAGNKYFSTLDLMSGYWQVGMDPDSQEKTAFITHSGLFEFTVMPFGLCNAPATFQRLMEHVLVGLVREKCIVYLDDILIIGRFFEEHLTNLQTVLTRLLEAGLKLKPEKCKLTRTEVDFFGYVVSENGVSTNPAKVSAVTQFPRPKDLKSLRAFLGLMSYYRRFIPCFSTVAHPLYNLTRKDTPFQWSKECEAAFDKLRSLLTEAPVLAYPNFQQSFTLETDASGIGLGAVLSQQQEDGVFRPIAFASRTLQNHERNYGISELEALGVVWAVKHFRPYIYGHHCTVYTDHEALKSLLNTPHPSGKLARWGMALQELDLKIEYRPGKGNARADALSRYPVSLLAEKEAQPQTHAVIASIVQGMETTGEEDSLRSHQQSDPDLQKIFKYLEDGILPKEEKVARELVLSKPQYTIQEGILYHVEPDKTLRIIPPASHREKLFHETHDGPFSAHLREAKIHSQLSKHFWWPHMRRDISQWCRACLTCASRNIGKVAKPPLTPIPVGGPFDRVGVDVLQLPRTKRGNKYAVVFMDYLTKWPEVYATQDQTAPTIARLFVEQFISRHGVPRQLLSDRGPAFLSKLLLAVCDCIGSKKINTSAYHPQSDGLVERFNRTLTDMLAKSITPGVTEWDERLPYVLFAYRATLQASTRESPFFLLYGRDPQLPSEVMLQSTSGRGVMCLDDYKSTLCREMRAAWDQAQQAVLKAQKQQKQQHDREAKNADFEIGDRVFVYMPATKTGQMRKLARPFKGPYRVMARHPNGAEVRLVSQPKAPVIRVALNRLRRCPREITEPWAQKEKTCQEAAAEPQEKALSRRIREAEPESHVDSDSPPSERAATETPTAERRQGDIPPWRGRLRPRTRGSRTS